MNLFQGFLMVISSVMLTVGIIYLIQSIFIYKKIDKYFNFSICAIGVSFFIFFEFMLSHSGYSDEAYLLFHKFRWLGFGMSALFWFSCLYEICFDKKLNSRLLVVLLVSTIVFLPTDLILSLPIRHISIEYGSIVFDYRFAKSGIVYNILVTILMVYFLYFFIKIIFSKIPSGKKLFGSTVVIQFIVILHDYGVSIRKIDSIMLLEYVIFLFIIWIFVFFLIEALNNNKILDNINKYLNDEVDNKTKELRHINDKLFTMATYDPLTGVYNRPTILDRLAEEKNRLDRYEKELPAGLVIFFIDLDNFKYYNDNFGHHVGDFILKLTSKFIGDMVRESDLVARYGGDEFLVVLPETEASGGELLIKRIYHCLKERDYFKKDILDFIGDEKVTDLDYPVTFSTGVSSYEKDRSLDEMLKLADEALYRGKKGGKNNFVMGE